MGYQHEAIYYSGTHVQQLIFLYLCVLLVFSCQVAVVQAIRALAETCESAQTKRIAAGCVGVYVCGMCVVCRTVLSLTIQWLSLFLFPLPVLPPPCVVLLSPFLVFVFPFFSLILVIFSFPSGGVTTL